MSLQEPIEIDVLLDVRDFLRANYWYLFRKLRLLFILFFLVGVIYPILYFTGVIGEPAQQQNYWGFLTIPALVAFLLIATYWGAKKQVRSNRSLQEKIRYSFHKSGFDAVAASSSGHMNWENIREAYETKNNFLLFISNNQMYTIPKRFFESGEQINSFKQLLSSTIQSRARLK